MDWHRATPWPVLSISAGSARSATAALRQRPFAGPAAPGMGTRNRRGILQKDRQNWLPAMPPIRVTFDTNAYSPVTRPQLSRIITTGWPLTADRLLSKKRRVAWWYIKWCIRHGRIRAAIPEAAFAAEVLPNV